MRSKPWGMLLAPALAFVAMPAAAAENCMARSIDSVGKCHGRAFARRVVDEQLRGVAATPAQPDGIDADLLATKLTRELSKGEWFPVQGTLGEWVLVARKGRVGVSPDYEMLDAASDDGPTMIALVRITPGANDGSAEKPRVTVLATRESLIGGTGANVVGDTGTTANAPIVPCIDPEAIGGRSEYDSSGAYPDIAGQFRWVRLSPQHQILAARVSRNEGYAGGGGTFTGEIMLEVGAGQLIPIACYAISRYQMFGGEWNPDGTRQHPESQAGWRVRATGKGEWPTLQLVPSTMATPSAILVWDNVVGHYK